MTTPLLTRRCPACEAPVELDHSNGFEEIRCTNPECRKLFTAEARPVDDDGSAELIVPGQAVETVPEPVLETVLIRPAMVRRYPLQFLSVVVLITAGLACIGTWVTYDQSLMGLVGLVLLGYGSYRAAAWWAHTTRSALTITGRDCIIERGGFTPMRMAVPLARVREVQIAQTLYGKLTNVGDLVITTNDDDKHQVVVMAVAGPKAVAELIHDRHNRA